MDAEPWAALAQALGDCAHRNVPLSRYAGVGIGGPAELLVIAQRRDELIETLRLVEEAGVWWRVFGGLTNVLLPDSGLRGVVILNHTRHVDYHEKDDRLVAESGAIMTKVAQEAVHQGWDGLTWAVGLPGTVGGAVVNNAGAFDGVIAKTLVSAEVLVPGGGVETVEPDWFAFQYRSSKLKGRRATEVIVSATFQLAPGDPAVLASRAAEYTERRQRTQPPGKTLGSTFKNPPGDYAGRLIEAVGLKGARCGGCYISEKHANFFMNDGNGTAADYGALIHLAQTEVERQFGIHLEPEIEMIADGAIAESLISNL
ncbi:MAG TPA: UDP-N-acetylmuramate dehydrogenase [Anaerolineae bacterium]|nr:UDP-N-acetylmuramate dehydrogenase [Anaerolineae bacterium]HQH38639.1 UDP-N-acetylmuramate dehydrogenase [Anaerolineae bacterium]